MTTDDETGSATERTRSSIDHDEGRARDREAGASDTAAEAIRDIEQRPLGDRAPGYQALADRLRVELEQSDPHAAR
ncbi:hypothetical protein [Agromyces humatus]|uniref:DUF2795 domain-containing protein n=1 Tax=Agromyces humatus TaxID=279573 RepID=A0ABP4X8X2_9MICO|nr:hypothetical protein [Agromyces humatus]